MDIGYIDFKEIMRRLKREERDRVCQWFKSQLASFLPSTKIGKLDTLEKLAKMKASKSRETGFSQRIDQVSERCQVGYDAQLKWQSLYWNEDSTDEYHRQPESGQ